MKITLPKASLSWAIFLLVLTGVSVTIGRVTHADTATISVAAYSQPASGADWHVVSSPAGIDCTGGSGTCSFDFTKGIDVTLTATPPSGRLVNIWESSTDCHGSNPSAENQNSCTITASQPQTVTLYWVYSTYNISVATKGTGSGTITSSSGGLSCPSACSHTYVGSDVITITATPAAGSTFAGWGTAAEGGTTCWISGKEGGPPQVRGTSPSCKFGVSINRYTQTYTAAVAFFDKTATTAPASTPAAAPTTSPTPPAAPPTVTAVTVNGETAPTQDAKPLSLPDNKAVTLSGQTIAGGTVTLYIFSEPRTATVKADATGKWSYAISGLKAGSHHVEYTVTDPATNTTSTRTQLLAFTLTAAKNNTSASSVVKTAAGHNKTLWIVLIIAVAVLAGAAGFGLWWFKYKDKTKSETPPPTVSTQV